MISLSQQTELNHYSRKAEFAQNLMSTICGEHRLDTIYKDTLDFHYDGMRLPNKKMAIGTISYGANVAINIYSQCGDDVIGQQQLICLSFEDSRIDFHDFLSQKGKVWVRV